MTENTRISTRGKPKLWEPPTPQLIRNAKVFIVGYKADPIALADHLPPGLKPHENGLVQMNMYQVGPDQTSGFGPFTLTYITIEIDGYDSELMEGAGTIPGRYFAYYWNSSPRVRAFVRENVGAKAQHGDTRKEYVDGKLVSTLSLGGRDVIRVTSTVGETIVATVGGHLNYYAHREFLRPDGGAPVLSELVELPLPFVADVYESTVHDITFDFPDGHPATALRPLTPLQAPSVLHASTTFTYSMGRTIHNYLSQ
jgi:acetoacetate decarboxylase